MLSTVLPVCPRRMAHCVCNPELGLGRGQSWRSLRDLLLSSLFYPFLALWCEPWSWDHRQAVPGPSRHCCRYLAARAMGTCPSQGSRAGPGRLRVTNSRRGWKGLSPSQEEPCHHHSRVHVGLLPPLGTAQTPAPWGCLLPPVLMPTQTPRPPGGFGFAPAPFWPVPSVLAPSRQWLSQ